MTDDELRDKVNGELLWNSKVDAEAVAVSVKDGVVTLRGTVGDIAHRLEARRVAEGVQGVVDVDDQIEVRPLDGLQREDADLRGDVLQALMNDAQVPDTVDVHVKNTVVTLTGTVNDESQRDEAENAAGSVGGVTKVVDKIEVVGSSAT